MKLRVTTDMEGHALVKALLGTASAYGVEDSLAHELSKSIPSGWSNWETRLKELSHDTGEDIWADPKMQKLEDRLVKYAMTFASAWIEELRPQIRKLLRDPSEVKYEDFVMHTDEPVVDVTHMLNLLTNVKDIAQKNVTHMRTEPSQSEWVEVPKPIYDVKPIKAKANAEWIAKQSAGSKMREWAEGMREDVRWQVVQAIRGDIPASELEDRLKQRWTEYGNRVRTIAATELSMAYNDAALVLLAGKYGVVPPIGDEKVCKECRHWLEGKVFYVLPSPPENPTKQELEQYLWPGKSNIGRKREDWVPCLPLHPNCRHMVVQYKGGDPYAYRVK